MSKSDHGITLDTKNQEQPTDKKRAQDSSSPNIPGSGGEADNTPPHQTGGGVPRQSEDDIQREQLGPVCRVSPPLRR
jgi:hypothetical protein